ncbi:UDP-N-acetylglucosamine--undecaprenyl-phosphate N-acetylglucosaminephosphotransferase [Vibrio sp. sp1]|uniref:UDP-N-acetylglucosamine--undecaprenyl-phosphate N-acetylglucosaminephosphotransferase n=1 Tax=Vibrio TaxID=662 RepID=UPI00196605E5|nr:MULTISPECIES: UDP-N-acetylglucosamine--undecaprenyl-phosphate N-acetylglucosaminephosphotransferase [Vibrio]MBO0162900.1 UDP-N-acetylglucosamine--undecaprenyl-phosphate N-acetylglucosaminephosphotransferase [Vibrio alginolyticus]MDA0420454.1 UDP-N-acetylglucosamine--undecaprenyl-phosphate N-acetylglucosaminephosphotransferase [Vibrio alginolyticus]MDW2331177.1 UDP-N-acetylglucosamine--undecaprenyl-phosphate N-acetylglucosaminephosphotransferase [Vibrio sp. 1069]QRZ21180.1 UDP-N-acetylglucosa
MLILVAATLAISIFSLLSMRKVALNYGLVDKPSYRKRHKGDVPFIGGIALYITLFCVSLLYPNLIPNRDHYLVCGFILTLIGTLDDKLDISATARILVLTTLSVWLVQSKNISISNLGDLFAHGDIIVRHGDTLLTAAAVIGCISAFNMVDGIDGLLGALASVTFGALSYLFYLAGEEQLASFCLIFVISLLPYILCNLELIPRRSFKVFMGDSGSFLIGFTIIWLLIHSSQTIEGGTSSRVMKPVTALWIIAIPLMDMAMVMMRRMKKGKSPLKPDRLHLHHICMRLGLSSRQTLLLLFLLGVFLSTLGILGQVYNVNDSLMLLLFVTIFVGYMLIMKYIWRITSTLRKYRNSTSKTCQEI